MILICTKSRPKGRITMYNMRQEGKKHSMTRNRAKCTTIDNRETRTNMYVIFIFECPPWILRFVTICYIQRTVNI